METCAPPGETWTMVLGSLQGVRRAELTARQLARD
jgi:hypothetical protein